MLAWWSTTDDFAEIMGSGIKSALYTDRLKELDQNLAPDMVITNGLSSDEPEFFVEDGEVWQTNTDDEFFDRDDTDHRSNFF
jgi:hypothetical protein